MKNRKRIVQKKAEKKRQSSKKLPLSGKIRFEDQPYQRKGGI